MTTEEIKIYREIQRNAETAMKAIDTIASKVYDDSLALQIAGQSLKYSELYNEASRRLIEAREESYQSSVFSDAVLKTGIHYNTMLNTSTAHLAEVMIKGGNNGILEMEKVLKHNGRAGEQSADLARQLIALQENNIATLKDYL